ncbi:MAG: hypothetical protein HXX08_23490 [Chloroflexi bacterium]|uniref:Leucine-binding protein domain-containing protein n=1 Tax=Candidatus Chlorohelix allophototropha TaxID=3003348 RepID=A0A8T7M9T9_9CHLR|nr:hypothetical protein [Chloroflexota bacterium]WJW68766.1 hypothetical protein OZ401_004383 [Chloroflexota bacterium L227-S17]
MMKFRNLSILVVVLLLMVVLAACGDSPTATTVPTTTAAVTTTAAATAPKAAATTTTVATITAASATKVAATTTVATTAATGGDADLPTFAGATVVTLPDNMQSQSMKLFGSVIKNIKVSGYKVSTNMATLKNSLPKAFSDAGWADAVSLLPAGTFSGLETTGQFVQAYQKNKKVVIVVAYPSSLMSPLVPELTATDNLFVLYVGEPAG